MANTNKKEKNPNPYKDPGTTQKYTPKTKIGKYLFGVKKEIGRVTWPNRHQIVTYTTVVMICSAFFAVAFWAVDTGVLSGLKALLSLNI